MRNRWKGLIVGGLTGIAGGAVLDMVGRASGQARRLGESAKDHAPEAASWLRRTTGRAVNRVQDADVKGHAHDAAHRVHDAAGRVDASEVGTRIAAAAKDAAKEASHTVKDGARAAQDAVAKSS
jgi:hypothetical protein